MDFQLTHEQVLIQDSIKKLVEREINPILKAHDPDKPLTREATRKIINVCAPFGLTGLLFLLSMFFAPLAGIVPSAATGPALVVVGALIISQVAGIDWNDMGIALPAFATLVMMPFTYSIANGVGAGMVLYTIIALGRGDWRRIHPLMAVVAALFVWYFARGVI